MGSKIARWVRPMLAAGAVAALLAGCGAVQQQAAARRKPVTSLHAAPQVSGRAASHTTRYLRAAVTAYDRGSAWWDPRRRWYRQFLPGHGAGTATMWGIVHLFGATNAIALADPTPAHVAAAKTFANAAERYWNPDLRPVPAYGPSPGSTGPDHRTWYDDEAWWGVAFYDAFRATGDRQYLASAARSLRFVDSGWDPKQGGIYWDNRRTFKSSESLAGGTLTAAALYQATHDPRYLQIAQKYIAWADATIKGKDGLYGARSTPAVPMAYVEGPMAEALLRLCKATGNRSYCSAGEELMRRTAAHFQVLQQGPQYDAIYLRSVVQIYRMDHNPRWYAIVARAADEALAHAANARGLYLKLWDGRPITTIGAPADKLQTHAATTSVFAWLAAATPRSA
jgi:uncharacterized protein YyaL (SSP411 family)